MTRIAREGLREIVIATVALGGAAAALGFWFWPAALPFAALWIFVIAFFRDPARVRDYAPGEFCAPADGRITEVTDLEHYPPINGPAVRIGIFLSIFNVHVNRMPCTGRVISVQHRPGSFLDARHADSGPLNESNTLVLDPGIALPGPVVVRQVVGVLARRIICHATVGQEWPIGGRFGIIKFGSRTELIIPRRCETEIRVSVGDRVRGGLTILARQPLAPSEARDGSDRQIRPAEPTAAA